MESQEIKISDVEVELNAAGPIIHIFPPIDAHQSLFDIFSGIELRKLSESLIKESEHLLTQPISDEKKIAILYLKRTLQKANQNADLYAQQFIKGINKAPWNGK